MQAYATKRLIKNNSFIYRILRAWVKLGLQLFYRDIKVGGLANIPENAAVIYAVNHPNTLLDALLTTCHTKQECYFLARGDVFKKPALAKLFAVFKMLPVFRERDGLQSVRNNQAIFDVCSTLLKSGNSLIIFPEGSHNREWRIRDLRKGLARIAQGAFQKDKKCFVVPVGLYYNSPSTAFSEVYINYGKAIDLSDFLGNEETAIAQQKALTDAIGTELKRVSLHIQNADYSPIETLVKEQLANADFDDVEVEFNALKARIEAAENSKPLPEFTSKESQTGFAKLLNLSTLILSSPLFAIGFIVNLPNLVANYFVQKQIKDIHFKASVNFGLSLIINTLVLLILAIYQFLSSYTWYGALITTVFFGFCLFFHKLWQEKRLNYFA